jgi:hypothetical protein
MFIRFQKGEFPHGVILTLSPIHITATGKICKKAPAIRQRGHFDGLAKKFALDLALGDELLFFATGDWES